MNWKALLEDNHKISFGDQIFYTHPTGFIYTESIPYPQDYVTFKSDKPFGISQVSPDQFKYSYDSSVWYDRDAEGPSIECTTPSQDNYYYIHLIGLNNSTVHPMNFFSLANDEVNPQIEISGYLYALGNYNNRFQLRYCDHLFAYNLFIVSAIDLEIPATVDCRSMFEGCAYLVDAPYIDYDAIIDPEIQFELVPNQFQQMFLGCTNLVDISNLEFPDIQLERQCYASMFQACSNLEELPELQSTKLAAGCYYRMFYACHEIKLATTQDSEYTVEFKIPSQSSIDDPSITGTYVASQMFLNTSGTWTGTPDINTAYYQNITSN